MSELTVAKRLNRPVTVGAISLAFLLSGCSHQGIGTSYLAVADLSNMWKSGAPASCAEVAQPDDQSKAIACQESVTADQPVASPPVSAEVATIQPAPPLSKMTALAMPIPPRRSFSDGGNLTPTLVEPRKTPLIPAEVDASPLSNSAGPAPVLPARPIAPDTPKERAVSLSTIEPPVGINAVAPLTTGSLPAGSATRQPSRQGVMRLEDAVARAVLTYPEIRINQTRLLESKAGIDIARSALFPTADARLATGGNFSGSYEGKAVPYNVASNAADNRFDGGIILRQLVWDFGATRADIARARFLSNAEQERLNEKIDEIAWRTSQSYLKILEHRALIALIDDTVAAHKRLLKIVAAQEAEGHGTSADSSRILSRLNDITAVRSDVGLQLGGAEDQFERLTQQRAGRLIAVPDYYSKIAKRPEVAISAVLARNPRLASMRATTQSIESELAAQRASNKPKLMFEFDTESKNFRSGKGGRTQLESRAMLSLRFKLMDGGLAEAQERQIQNRIETSELTLMNERQQLESDIRQAYRAIESAGAKSRLLDAGVSAAKRAEELYLEQFKAGKRTVFELLDGQMAVYTARRSQIESRYARHKAVIDILRYTGALTAVLAGRTDLTNTVAAAERQ